ncbi:glycosyltransferase family A protein [Psychroserpens algicola]|uniref:glycosyltransferase family A protein n=1 Tax=Psychroserpens algicola TaxID=1719034 RepID=UPI001953609D|nr:glycosyltransferase family A protein [Psychroserpens algicola]
MLKYQQIQLTYIVPVYLDKNLDALYHLIKTYEGYDLETLKQIHFIFIDDHSPVDVKLPKNCQLNYSLAKISTHIMWNQGGARNLGVHLAKSQKMVLTDLDHTFPESVFQFLIQTKTPNQIFTFKRIRDNEVAMPHYNTFFLSKSTYFKSLGVDEEFCGHYGHEDVFFIEFQKRVGTKLYTYRDQTIFSHEHKNSKQPQHQLHRDSSITKPLFDAKYRILKDKNRDPFDAHSRLFLNFEWHQVEESIKL